MVNRLGVWALCGVAAAVTSGCNRGSAPIIEPIGDQTAVVGQELMLEIRASDPDGDSVEYGFEAQADLPDLAEDNPALTVSGDGNNGVFTWTPLASQVGSHAFDFTAKGGGKTGRETILITVQGASGEGSIPIFRKPLGSGTVLDLGQAQCVSFEIEIDDPDSSEIILSQEAPILEGATLDAAPDGRTGTWSWCPTRAQIEADDRFEMTLAADDQQNTPVTKEYLIVLRKRGGADCPGEAPVIEHTAMDFSTLLDLELRAQISDDQGLKDAPILCSATEFPGDPIDFSKMTLVPMDLVDGDMQNGQWRGILENPTAAGGTGTMSDLFYLISATDNDDEEGDCDHLTDNPPQGLHQVTVTNSGEGGAGVCQACSFDVQCGSAGDLCLPQDSDAFCGKACSGGDCDAGFVCSPNPVSSIDGAMARQCVPNSGSCGGGGTCTDDDSEPNDSLGEAQGSPLPPGTLNGRTLCPGDDDWYQFDLSARAELTVTLNGDSPPDMDLRVADGAGILIDNSLGGTSNETVTTPCVDPGTYFAQVFSSGAEQGGYSLSFSVDENACAMMNFEGDCCIDNNTPGCDDAAITTCVCGMDDFCCNNEWDGVCAGIAQNSCGAVCAGPCCTAHTGPGCIEPAVEACVCGQDPLCCDPGVGWDSICVGRVDSLGCRQPACSPDDSDGACCEANGSPGCEINSIEMCVCAVDPLCCSVEWDALCVSRAVMEGCAPGCGS